MWKWVLGLHFLIFGVSCFEFFDVLILKVKRLLVLFDCFLFGSFFIFKNLSLELDCGLEFLDFVFFHFFLGL